jgi:hypothetical protein
MRAQLLVGVLLLGLLTGCNIRKPFVREEDPWVVRGTRVENGDELVSRHVLRPFMVSITPIGPMDGDHFTEYALRSGAKVTRLEFLDEEHRARTHPDFSREIIAVPRSDRWVVFHDQGLTRELTNLTIVVFNRDGIQATQTIPKVKRRVPRNRSAIAGYLMSIDATTGDFTVETSSGVVLCSPAQDRLGRPDS